MCLRSSRFGAEPRGLLGFHSDWPGGRPNFSPRRESDRGGDLPNRRKTKILQQAEKALLSFVEDADQAGWAAALKQHYKFQSVQELQDAWQQWVKRRLGNATIQNRA